MRLTRTFSLGHKKSAKWQQPAEPFWNACILATTFDDLPPTNWIIALSLLVAVRENPTL
jgi:hypothetical protein